MFEYQQKKAPRETEKAGRPQTAEGKAAAAPLRADTSGAGDPAGLAAAMQARMDRTFGDLSAVKNYVPPVVTETPAPAEPYTGPVTHALSDASPSPAVAGPMQAKRETEEEKQNRLANEDVDKLFRISAGQTHQSDEFRLNRQEIQRQLYAQYHQENLQNGMTEHEAHLKAQSRAGKEARKNAKNKQMVSQKDRQWKDDFLMNPSARTMEIVQNRRDAARSRLLESRRRTGDESTGGNKGQLDMEASHSREGTEFKLYDEMLKQMKGSVSEENELFGSTGEEEVSEDKKAQNEAEKIAYYYGDSKEGKELLSTDEGKQMEARIMRDNLANLAEMATPKKKWWQFWK